MCVSLGAVIMGLGVPSLNSSLFVRRQRRAEMKKFFVVGWVLFFLGLCYFFGRNMSLGSQLVAVYPVDAFDLGTIAMVTVNGMPLVISSALFTLVLSMYLKDNHSTSVEKDSFQKGKQEGLKEGIQICEGTIHKAILHKFRPKFSLPPVADGKRRMFWICVRVIRGGGMLPVNREICFTDLHFGIRKDQDPEVLMGAPSYGWIDSGGQPDRLAMLGVVYTLNTEPSPF